MSYLGQRLRDTARVHAQQSVVRLWVFGLGPQRIVAALAGSASDTPFVGNRSHDSRSFVNAAEQVGKHAEGVAGWRAEAGSGGIAGGATTGGNKAGNAV